MSCVSILSMGGTLLLGPQTFEIPVKVSRLLSRLRELHPEPCFDLLLGERLLAPDEELHDVELVLSAVAGTDYGTHPINTFEDLCLSEELCRGIYGYGFTSPAGLQRTAVRPIIDGRDLLVQGRSGTGKTHAYLIGALQRLDIQCRATQVLVLVPTRELVCPIQKVAADLGTYLGATSFGVVSGRHIRADIEALQEQPHLVIGTPGRVGELVQRRALCLDELKMFILDETDNLMERGFKGLVFDTLSQLPPSVQLAVFGGTIKQDVQDELTKFLRRPVLLAEPVALSGMHHLADITSLFVDIEREELKWDYCFDLIFELPRTLQVMLHCRNRQRAAFAADKLNERAAGELGALLLHSDIEAVEREAVLTQFQGGEARFLVLATSALAGRISPGLALLVNVDLPESAEEYILLAKMLGRRRGTSQDCKIVNFITGEEHGRRREWEDRVGIVMQELSEDAVLAIGG